MSTDIKVFEIFAPLLEFPLFQVLGDFLNRLGKGDALAFICILMILYGFVRGKAKILRSGGAGILVVAASGIAVQILKHLIGRARPQENLGAFHFIGPNLSQGGFESFPSGHAMSSFAWLPSSRRFTRLSGGFSTEPPPPSPSLAASRFTIIF